jgi:hypothetical protein
MLHSPFRHFQSIIIPTILSSASAPASRYNSTPSPTFSKQVTTLHSLPEVPAFEDSNFQRFEHTTITSEESRHSSFQPTSPLQSTPTPPSTQNTIRLQSSTSNSTRFAQSFASRASRSGSTFSSSLLSTGRCQGTGGRRYLYRGPRPASMISVLYQCYTASPMA